MFENMTQQENDFIEYMKTAPGEQVLHFRNAFNELIKCYGVRPASSMIAITVNKEDGTLRVDSLNNALSDSFIALLLAVEVVGEQLTATDKMVVQSFMQAHNEQNAPRPEVLQ